jgi:hypothetical protein
MKRFRVVGRMLVFIAMTAAGYAQEFPIAVDSDNTFGGGGAFDGTNFLFAILGDASNRYSITAQRVSGDGDLVGSRFSLGQTGSSPMVAFDGTNFLVAWADSFPSFGAGDTNGIGNIYGQFVSTTGTLVGSSFTIVTGVNIKWGKGRGTLVFEDTTYFLTYCKGPDHHTDYLYGQRISKAGALIGGAVQISSHYAREVAVAFDGTNYLVAWCRVDHPNVDRDIYGQFVSTSGSLVGGNFLIDGSPNASDNPVSMTFDGSRYCVAYHDQAEDTTGRWNIYARFVSMSGVVAERFLICDSSKSPTYASAAFDGTNYLITWIEFAAGGQISGRFFNASGVPIDTAFTVFDAVGGKFPIGGVAGFINGRFLLGATRTDPEFTDGDVYGMFLPSSTTDVQRDAAGLEPDTYELAQNYPNPLNPSTTIRYALPSAVRVKLVIHDLLGREIAALVDEEQSAGWKEVVWNASAMSSGVYFYRLTAGSFVQTRKLVVMK